MPNAPARPFHLCLTGGLVAVAIAAGVTVALAAAPGSAPGEATRNVLTPTASELALTILPRARAAADLSGRSCAPVRRADPLRCRLWGTLL